MIEYTLDAEQTAAVVYALYGATFTLLVTEYFHDRPGLGAGLAPTLLALGTDD